MALLKMNFENEWEAQDMISILTSKYNISAEEAILSVITEKNFKRIMKEGWAELAVNNWFIHNNNDNIWEQDGTYAISYNELKNPLVDIDFSPKQINMIDAVKHYEKVEIEKVISYFLIFEMESLGYHI